MRTITEYHDPRLTGEGAIERFAAQEGREVERLPDGDFRFADGVKTYRPVMSATGWKIVVVREWK